MHNLIKNAIDALEGEGEITLRLKIVEKFVIIEIEDNGKGFDSEVSKNLFEPFYSSGIDGTGLGLYITKLLAEADDAEIIGESSEDKTVFSLKYPLILGNKD